MFLNELIRLFVCHIDCWQTASKYVFWLSSTRVQVIMTFVIKPFQTKQLGLEKFLVLHHAIESRSVGMAFWVQENAMK